MERDDAVRMSCFASLAVLVARFGDEIPYTGGLDQGFPYQGRRVPFLSHMKGIYRAAAQRGPAALSLNTSANSPYDDAALVDGFSYAYRAAPIDHPDNKALRAAHAVGVPIAYFVGTRPGWYRPTFPAFVTGDDPLTRHVVITPGAMVGPVDEPEPVPILDDLERRYVVREVRVRLHQARFRGAVIPAYRDQCAVCRLKEIRLLDAAHIVGDVELGGMPVVPNGLSLCTIHHRAFDQHLLGISPDYEVRLARRLLDDDDGPMLEVLKQFDGATLELPARKSLRPDRERLAERFTLFANAV